MPARDKKRRIADAADDAAAWLAEAQRELDGGTQARAQLAAAAEPDVKWPPSIAAFADACCRGAAASGQATDVRVLAALVAALRLAHTFHVRAGSSWCDNREAALSAQLSTWRANDGEFDASVRSFHSSGVLHGGGGGSAPAGLRFLRVLGAYDALYWAVWALACRQHRRVPHPCRMAEHVQRALLATGRGAAAVRRLLRVDVEAARCLGLRAEWLDDAAAAHPSYAFRSPWMRGAPAMLRLLRARWLEAVVHVAVAGVDATDPRVRASVLRWQLIGRDAAARHCAFACPSPDALRTILCTLERRRSSAARGEIVELGAGNGYWSKLLVRALAAAHPKNHARGACSVRALDVQPPAEWRQPADSRVVFGTADDLRTSGDGGGDGRQGGGNLRPPGRRGSEDGGDDGGGEDGAATTLLLCMPSPGEPGIAEDALAAFSGRYVAYVGEWGSGMTGTLALHAALLAAFELVSTTPLPCMPLTRVALHVLRRRSPVITTAAAAAAAATHPGARCCHCGGARGLRSCPWTRRLLLCSERCHAAAATQHAAAISWTYCGAECSTRPPFAEFQAHAEVFLTAAGASEAEWLRLAQATPQPERELPP